MQLLLVRHGESVGNLTHMLQGPDDPLTDRGRRQAREIAADEALRWGLVHRVAPAARTENAALELATGVAALDPDSVARLKRMLHEHDGVVERSAAEGRGQVEWQRSGPGLP